MELFSRIRQAAWLPALLFIVLLLMKAPAFGQAATGNVTGVASDANGAVIANATVLLTDTLTGTVRKTTTNGHGFFAFASVAPSTAYKFEVTATGFNSWESQPFPLHPAINSALLTSNCGRHRHRIGHRGGGVDSMSGPSTPASAATSSPPRIWTR